MSELVEVVAVVRTSLLERLVHLLHEAGVPRLTVTSVHAIGRGVDPDRERFAVEDGEPYQGKSMLQLVSAAERAEMIVELICRTAATGRRGDGIVYLRPVLGVTKIRTRATGLGALD